MPVAPRDHHHHDITAPSHRIGMSTDVSVHRRGPGDRWARSIAAAIAHAALPRVARVARVKRVSEPCASRAEAWGTLRVSLLAIVTVCYASPWTSPSEGHCIAHRMVACSLTLLCDVRCALWMQGGFVIRGLPAPSVRPTRARFTRIPISNSIATLPHRPWARRRRRMHVPPAINQDASQTLHAEH